MELKDDDYLVIVNKILRNAYEKLKKGKRYNYEEVTKFLSSYQKDYASFIFLKLYNDGYLKPHYEIGHKSKPDSYVITPKGLDYLFSDSNMKELNKQY